MTETKHTCPECGDEVIVWATLVDTIKPHGWRINDAEMDSIDLVCESGHEVNVDDLVFEDNGPPAFWEMVDKARELVQDAYEQAVEDGNPDITGPLAEALVWLDGKRPLSE